MVFAGRSAIDRSHFPGFVLQVYCHLASMEPVPASDPHYTSLLYCSEVHA